jgi:hypothetical protein
MKRIDTATRSVDLFGAGKDGFRNSNKGAGISATQVDADWCNHVQEELANFIEGEGIALDPDDRTQLSQAVAKAVIDAQRSVILDEAVFESSVSDGEAVYWDSANSRFDEAVADGTAKQNAVGIADVTNSKVYAFGSCPILSGFTPGSRYYLSSSVAGGLTTTAPSTNVVQVGIAKSATELIVDIDQSGYITQAQADARYTGIQYMLVQHQTAQGVTGGNSSAGIQTRPLNTVVANTITGASLASNQVTLPAGTYRVQCVAAAFHVNSCKIAIYNVTDAAYIQQGMSVNGESTLTDLMTSEISLQGRFTLSGTKVIEMRQYTEVAATNGLGSPVNSMGVEVYASLEIIKES